MTDRHRLLERQIARHFGEPPGEPGPDLAAFFDSVDRAYRQADRDRASLERSLEAAARESEARYRRLLEIEEPRIRLLETISRQLRSALTPILGYAQMLERMDAVEEGVRRCGRGILRAAKRQIDLVDELLAAARAEGAILLEQGDGRGAPEPPEAVREVLLIEDDENTLDFLTALLATAGYRTLAARDGRAGIQALEKQVPDLLIVDLELPDMSGTEILDLVEQRELEVPVLVCSAHPEDELQALLAGRRRPVAWVAKPFDVTTFTDKVRQLAAVPEGPAIPGI